MKKNSVLWLSVGGLAVMGIGYFLFKKSEGSSSGGGGVTPSNRLNDYQVVKEGPFQLRSLKAYQITVKHPHLGPFVEGAMLKRLDIPAEGVFTNKTPYMTEMRIHFRGADRTITLPLSKPATDEGPMTLVKIREVL